jgi:dUTP pyrophosphatase
MPKCKLIEGTLVKATEGSAGYDIVSTEDGVIYAGQSAIFGTGVKIKLHPKYEAQVRNRSGLNFKNNVACFTGTIDADFDDYIKVKLYNLGNERFEIKKGDRIAQLVIAKHYNVKGAITKKHQRSGGFGSTGR